MLKPNKKKFRKNNKGRNISTLELKANALKFGTHGIQALEKGRISAKQIEAVRRAITNFLKRKGKV
jgi:large subunit ribosomal protein L16